MAETLFDYVRQQGITLRVTSGPERKRDDEGWEHDAYRVTLRRPGARPWVRIGYRMGTGHANRGGPEVAEVLNALILDGWTARQESFEDWCGEYGYDTDSRRAERMYRACRRTGDRMIEFLGGEDEFERAATEYESL
jgi:hypothetical protein